MAEETLHDERNEAASPKRREEFRERGEVARSREVVLKLDEQGVRSRVEAAASGRGFLIVATPEALQAGPQTPIKLPAATPTP